MRIPHFWQAPSRANPPYVAIARQTYSTTWRGCVGRPVGRGCLCSYSTRPRHGCSTKQVTLPLGLPTARMVCQCRLLARWIVFFARGRGPLVRTGRVQCVRLCITSSVRQSTFGYVRDVRCVRIKCKLTKLKPWMRDDVEECMVGKPTDRNVAPVAMMQFDTAMALVETLINTAMDESLGSS
ncbi:hypothetical protein H310_07387 [Aphanomyces invadans]|uniref:Uncharacterized protein n=1 Tax=Aphanomyces invadans TaxID=157072 RepID=A0A024U3S4_9STRA|nr:hypothetical protein H310_07387 [Aphanomyces invadans]ETW00865.1 hypothetical protein H310_07387 [Aphanomyces invadans]|eukprot:XP_008871000.1 hypothetical protein H310_07387 [Aphanomyces invadans]